MVDNTAAKWIKSYSSNRKHGVENTDFSSQPPLFPYRSQKGSQDRLLDIAKQANLFNCKLPGQDCGQVRLGFIIVILYEHLRVSQLTAIIILIIK